MKHPALDVETDAGIDGADTTDEDDPGKTERDDYVRAKRVKDPKHQGRRRKQRDRADSGVKR
jgi:hypothetical protein